MGSEAGSRQAGDCPATIGVLKRAVAIYLAHAYPEGKPPAVVERRLAWRSEDDDAPAPVHQPPFELASDAGTRHASIYALRLGNSSYPHMKLQFQTWPSDEGFLLSVNTHDQVAAPPVDSPEYERFRSLQAENQRLKQAIEAAWEAEGLPTFVRYLRDYLRHEEEGRDRDAAGSEPDGPGPG